jgi:hypothetical protein
VLSGEGVEETGALELRRPSDRFGAAEAGNEEMTGETD